MPRDYQTNRSLEVALMRQTEMTSHGVKLLSVVILCGARVPSSRPNEVTACKPENKETVDSPSTVGIASIAQRGKVNLKKQNYTAQVCKFPNVEMRTECFTMFLQGGPTISPDRIA